MVALRENVDDRQGRAGGAPMNRGATVVFAPTRLVPGPIPDQPGAGSHRFATDFRRASEIAQRPQPAHREADTRERQLPGSRPALQSIRQQTPGAGIRPAPIDFRKAVTRLAARVPESGRSGGSVNTESHSQHAGL
jgi:hypothetical protein